MEEFKNLKRVAMNELKKLDTAYAGKEEFTPTDCEKFDKLSHGLKCLLTTCAMLEAEEYSYEGGEMSGSRGRNAATGRYMSRDMGYSGYPGYSGYEPGYSGHFPGGPMYPAFPERRW